MQARGVITLSSQRRFVILLDEVLESFVVQGFAHDVDHAHGQALAQSFVVNEGCDCGNDGRNRIVLAALVAPPIQQPVLNLSLLIGQDLPCRHETINLWHVEVHEDKLELDLAALFLPVGDELVDRLLSTHSLLAFNTMVLKKGR